MCVALCRKEREKALMDDDVSLERVEDLIDKDLDERSTIDDKEGVAEEETKEEGKIEIWKSKRKPVTKKGEKSEVKMRDFCINFAAGIHNIVGPP